MWFFVDFETRLARSISGNCGVYGLFGVIAALAFGPVSAWIFLDRRCVSMMSKENWLTIAWQGPNCKFFSASDTPFVLRNKLGSFIPNLPKHKNIQTSTNTILYNILSWDIHLKVTNLFSSVTSGLWFHLGQLQSFRCHFFQCLEHFQLHGTSDVSKDAKKVMFHLIYV